MPTAALKIRQVMLLTIAIYSSAIYSSSVVADAVPRWYQPENVTNGHKVYLENCAVCHKPDASGTENWSKKDASGRYPPPPLNGTAHTWHHSMKVLAQAIKYGGVPHGGWMPAFENKLSKQEIKDVLAWIQSNWSDEVYQNWYGLNYGEK